MLYKFEFENDEERIAIISENTSKILVEEQYIIEGNFLIFSDEPLPGKIIYTQVPQEEFEQLKHESELSKAQNKAMSERADFVEDVVAEIAVQVYQ